MPYRRSYSGKTSRRSTSRSRSIARSGGQYRKAAKQLDGSRFVVMAQRGVQGENITLTIPVPQQGNGPNFVSDPQRFNALTTMLASEMGQQVCNMYDEFRIRSCKVKITPILTNAVMTGNLTMHSAWDRNGSLMRIALRDEGGATVYAQFNEGAHDLRTYSSLQSKHLQQFQNGSI